MKLKKLIFFLLIPFGIGVCSAQGYYRNGIITCFTPTFYSFNYGDLQTNLQKSTIMGPDFKLNSTGSSLGGDAILTFLGKKRRIMLSMGVVAMNSSQSVNANGMVRFFSGSATLGVSYLIVNSQKWMLETYLKYGGGHMEMTIRNDKSSIMEVDKENNFVITPLSSEKLVRYFSVLELGIRMNRIFKNTAGPIAGLEIGYAYTFPTSPAYDSFEKEIHSLGNNNLSYFFFKIPIGFGAFTKNEDSK